MPSITSLLTLELFQSFTHFKLHIMQEHIRRASQFICRLLGPSRVTSAAQLERFQDVLSENILNRIEHVWDTTQPLKGNAYRSITILNGVLDLVLVVAASKAGIPLKTLVRSLPTDFTLWIDPDEVSYRMGDHSQICSLYKPSMLKTDRHKKDGSQFYTGLEVFEEQGAVIPVQSQNKRRPVAVVLGSPARGGRKHQEDNFPAATTVQS